MSLWKLFTANYTYNTIRYIFKDPIKDTVISLFFGPWQALTVHKEWLGSKWWWLNTSIRQTVLKEEGVRNMRCHECWYLDQRKSDLDNELLFPTCILNFTQRCTFYSMADLGSGTFHSSQSDDTGVAWDFSDWAELWCWWNVKTEEGTLGGRYQMLDKSRKIV